MICLNPSMYTESVNSVKNYTEAKRKNIFCIGVAKYIRTLEMLIITMINMRVKYINYVNCQVKY